MKIFIQLPAHISLEQWKDKTDKGEIVGINDRDSPYGYSRIKELGHEVVFSKKPKYTFVSKIFRKILGIDIYSIYLNRNEIFCSDWVWTHTEYEALGVSLLKLMYKRDIKILGQFIWLIDKWDTKSYSMKKFYLKLIKGIDIVTTHSPLNAALAKEIFDRHVSVVKFGIPTEKMYPVKLNKKLEKPIKIIAVGNDIHRDWMKLIDSIKKIKDINLTIVSTSIDPQLIKGINNIDIRTFSNVEKFISFFRSNDLSIVPLKENTHASGLTAIQESIILGVPVLSAKVGGLDYYFDDKTISYYDDDLNEVIFDFFEDYQKYISKATVAQDKIITDKISANDYIKEQIRLCECYNKKNKEI